MKRLINFNAGPATLPQAVLDELSQAALEYKGTGMSIMELNHRGPEFRAILDEAAALVREFCGIGEEYEVLWMQGGGRMQFCMIPMNFLPDGGSAGYIDSGHWARDAANHAEYYGRVDILASSAQDKYTHLPEMPASFSKDLAYVHVTTNNTIYGTQLRALPDTGGVPLIADMSSDIFSRKIDYSACQLFYAVAQKNLGIAGATLVVVHRDLLKGAVRRVPPMLEYAAHARERSILNTAPVTAIYASLCMLRWIGAQKPEELELRNEAKSRELYAEIERNELFECRIPEQDRSRMNVVFHLKQEELTEVFVQRCERAGIVGVAGHRSAGGLRASLYNAMEWEGVQQLIAAMQEMERSVQPDPLKGA